MHPLTRRIRDLRGLRVRLHVAERKIVSTVDGICQGIEDDCVVLAPSPSSERTNVPLARVYAVTQIPGEYRGVV